MIFQRKPKVEQGPEDSLFLRMLWFLLATTCLVLVNMVDPETSSLSLAVIGLPVAIPLMVLYLWLGVAGCFLSYHYRHNPKPWLVGVGLVVIAVVIAWFVENLHYQFTSGVDIDPLLPTVHLVAGLFVAHTFEMRTRNDFNFSLGISLMLVFMTATLGKGLVFGALLLLYVCLAGVMLLLDCESRTFGSVCARKIDGLDFSLDSVSAGDKTGNLVFPIACMVALGAALFVAVPRAESIADQLTARFFRMLRPAPPLTAEEPMPATVRAIRMPIRVPGAIPSNFGRDTATPEAPTIKKPAASPGNTPTGNPGENAKPESGDGSGDKKDAPGARDGKNKNTKKNPGRDASGASASGAQPGDKNKKQNSPGGVAKKFTHDPNAKQTTPGETTDERNSGNKENKPGSQSPSSTDDRATAEGRSSSGQSKTGAHKKTGDKGDKTGTGNTSKDPDAPKKGQADSGTSSSSNPQSKKSQSSGGSNKPPSATPVKSSNQTSPKESLLPEALDTRDEAPNSEEVIFSVVCNRTVFFRKSILDTFDGNVWYCSDPSQRSTIKKGDHGLFWFPEHSIISVPSTVPSIRFKQQFKFEIPYGNSMPVAGAPDCIEYNAPSLYLDVCGTVHSDWGLVRNTEFEVISILPMYNVKDLEAAATPPPGKAAKIKELLENFLQVETTLDPKVVQMARTVSGGEGNSFVKAEKIAAHLRKNYTYTTYRRHDSDVKDTVNSFLLGQSKSGDCKDFASAFVVMCRSVGIPCRFVTGFASGDFDPSAGRRLIRHKHAHSWAEVYVPRGGWVPFDATPQGTLPERTAESERYLTTLNNQVKEAINKSGVAGKGATLGTPSAGLKEQHPVSVLTVMLALCFPGLIGYSALMFWRGFKERDVRISKHPASKIYTQFLRKLKLVGVVVRGSSTPGEVLEQLRAKIADNLNKGVGDSSTGAEFLSKVERFFAEYNKVYFGGQSDLHELKSLGFQLEAMIKKI